MTHETGAHGIAKGINRSLNNRLYTGDRNTWVEVRHILIEAISSMPAAQACCKKLIQAALSTPVDPAYYGYYADKPSCAPLPKSPRSAMNPQDSSWLRFEWDEDAMQVIERELEDLENLLGAIVYDSAELEPPTGMAYCGCDVCQRRELLAVVMPLLLDAYDQGRIRRVES